MELVGPENGKWERHKGSKTPLSRKCVLTKEK